MKNWIKLASVMKQDMNKAVKVCISYLLLCNKTAPVFGGLK